MQLDMNRYTFADLVIAHVGCRSIPRKLVRAVRGGPWLLSKIIIIGHVDTWQSTWHVHPALRGSQLINGVACNVTHRPSCTWNLPTLIAVAVLHQKLYIMAKIPNIDTDIAIFQNTDTEYRTDVKNTDKNTEYRYRRQIPTPTHHYIPPTMIRTCNDFISLRNFVRQWEVIRPFIQRWVVYVTTVQCT